MGAYFNSNMLFGVILLALGIALYIGIVINRYKTNDFKGKTAVTVTSICLGIIGFVLLVMGIVYEWPNLTENLSLIQNIPLIL